MSDKIIYLSDDNFDTYISNNKYILVDFWAEWCGPCKTISPILDEISDEYYNKLIIAKLNIDHNQIIVSKYNIKSVPTLLLFKNSEIVAKKIGYFTKNQLKEFIDHNLI